jgi:MscS family membrane protein
MTFAPPGWVPQTLIRTGPYQLAHWQWVALPVAAAIAWIVGRMLGRISHSVLSLLARRTKTRFDDELVENLAGPIALAWFVGAAIALIDLLDLPPTAEAFAHRVLHGGFLVAFFWALFRAVDVSREALQSSAWSVANPASRSLLALGSRVAKVLVGAMGVIGVVSALGYPVASLIAGLGIGGLALALAAQKTLENLFGAFAIGFDKPFREGDYVRIDTITGTVEAIGLRSTRIRTDDRTVVCFPNGRLADMRTENFAEQDRIRLWTVLGLSFSTTAAQMREVVAGIEADLRKHPKVHPDGISVRFRSLGQWTLDVEAVAWFRTGGDEFTLVRQELLLRMLEIVERAGTSLAFPTRTVLLESSGGRPEPPPAERTSTR